MASVMGQVLYGYNRDTNFDVGAYTGQIFKESFTHPVIYERILQLHARVRSVCSKVRRPLPAWPVLWLCCGPWPVLWLCCGPWPVVWLCCGPWPAAICCATSVSSWLCCCHQLMDALLPL
jgi:hypothetical protein